MSGILITAYDGAILGPIAKFLGWIMNFIYMGLSAIGIESVILCIIIITILIYMCMLPLTINQQKFAKLSQKMQPEIQAVQAKYKGKKDQASMQAMNQETQLIYQKYGVNPTGSCLPLIIQMPILFALYRVFYNVPAYIGSVKNTFSGLVNSIQSSDGYIEKLVTLVTDNKITTSSGISAKTVAEKLGEAQGSDLQNYIVDILYKLPSTAWDGLSNVFPGAESQIDTTLGHLQKFNYMFGLNISDTPWNIIKNCWTTHPDKYVLFIILALLIPVISWLTQYLNIKLMPQAANNNDQMANQMKTMNTMMPLISLFMCFTVPVGLGVYWIMSALVRLVQQYFINRHIANLDLDDIIAKNQAKAAKKREKLGVLQNQISNNASIKTKSIDSSKNESFSDKEAELEKAREIKSGAVKGSLAAKANKVKEFNEKNTR